jgi:hypothetical protein
LKFDQSFEKSQREWVGMRQPETMQSTAMTPVPRSVVLLGSFVLEVLQAALASLIGGLLFVHYQFSRPAIAPEPAAAASPASPEMVKLVRDEHAMLRQFLAAQEAVQQREIAADDEDARAQPAAKLPAAKGHAGVGVAVAKPIPPRHRTANAATAALAVTPAPGSAAVVIARAQQIPGPAPAAAPAHDEPALIADTLAVKDQVVGVALHAVKVMGGIPVWIGRRLGGDDLNSQSAGTAS